MKQYLIARTFSYFQLPSLNLSLSKPFSFVLSLFFLEVPDWTRKNQTISLISFLDATQYNVISTRYRDHLVRWFTSAQEICHFLLSDTPSVFVLPAYLLSKSSTLLFFPPGSLIMSTNIGPKTFSWEYPFSHGTASWYLFIVITAWKVTTESFFSELESTH